MSNGLKALLAKQQGNNSESKVGEAAETASDTSPHEGSGPSERGTQPVSRPSSTTKTESPRPRNPFASASGGGESDSGKQSGAGDSAGSRDTGGSSESRPKLAGINLGTKSSDSTDSASGVAKASIDSLDALDQSEDEGVAPRDSMSGFADETPATAPTREIPDDLPKEQLSFIELLDGVYQVIHEPDMLGGVIRNIMIELQTHPEYINLVAPEDIRTMVRGMRESMGLARIQKQEKKSRRGGGSGKKAGLVDSDMLKDLDSLLKVEV